MFEWFEKMIKDIVWKAIYDFIQELEGTIEDKIYEFLSGLTAGQTISASPLVKIVAVDNAAETITLLVRGSFAFGGVTPFMRIEIVISRARADIHVDGEAAPIRIKQWNTVLGDLAVGDEKKKLYRGELGFGYDDGGGGSWLGQGSLKLIPLSFGAAIYGGFSDRGVIVGLDAEFPKGAAIPLGPTGLALRGIGGDFACNFVARLEKEGIPVADPTAADYVRWARDSASVDRWMAGPIDHTSVGVGIRTIICTKADEGYAFELNPVGFAVFFPSGTFVFGGKGKVLRMDGFGAEGYFVFDAESASLALGVGVTVDVELIKGSGQLDMFFSFSDPAAWYLDLGTETKPVKLEVLQKIPVVNILFSQKAEAYFRVNQHRVAFGATVGIGGSFKFADDLIELIAKLAVSLNAYVGWDPVLVNAMIKVHGEVGIKIWKFSFILSGDAEAEVYFPTPTLFRFEIKGKLDLPWPIPDIEFSKNFGDDDIKAPTLSSPLAAGVYSVNGAQTIQSTPVDAIHIISELKWNLDTDKPWPDLELAVPFSRRVTDRTGKVDASQAVTPAVQGGYTVTDELLELDIVDLTHNATVPDVGAVWADGPGGATAQLHVLGLDPYAWISVKIDTSSFPMAAPQRTVDIFFGYGPARSLDGEKQPFGDLVLIPGSKDDRLLTSFKPEIPTCLLESAGFGLSFAHRGGDAFQVNQLVLFLVMPLIRRRLSYPPLVTDGGARGVYADHGIVWGELHLVSVLFDFPAPVGEVWLRSEAENAPNDYVYAVRYREAPVVSTSTATRKLLLPGRYRLHLRGVSKAEHPSGGSSASSPLPAASPVDWGYDKEFEIAYPETLRPYIFYSSFGDARMFAKAQFPWTLWTADTWNPTLFGFGFPQYRGYKTAVRFMVPYVGAMFSETPLKLRLACEQGGETTEMPIPQPCADGGASLPPESLNWMAAHGGAAAPDQELVMSAPPPGTGPAKLTVLFDHPQHGEVRIDEWSGIVSAFDDFKAHLAMSGTSLGFYYDAAGRHTAQQCPLPKPGRRTVLGKIDAVGHYGELGGIGKIVLGDLPARKSPAGDGAAAPGASPGADGTGRPGVSPGIGPNIDLSDRPGLSPVIRQGPDLAGAGGSIAKRPDASANPGISSGIKPDLDPTGVGGIAPVERPDLDLTGLGGIAPIGRPDISLPGPIKPYPKEVTVTPDDWRLPAEFADRLGPLNGTSALRFAAFAAASGARFGEGEAGLAGINDAVPNTTVEAVVDAQGRPYALWLRTPEPIDWRRVTVSMAIRHITPDTGCPTDYAYRLNLEPTVSVLPGFDGSSAWLIGSVGGVPTRLPRGEYAITLTFDPRKPGLPALYPGEAVGPLPETAVLRLVMPLGLPWPPAPAIVKPFPIPPIPIPIPIPDPLPFPFPFPEPIPGPIGPLPGPVGPIPGPIGPIPGPLGPIAGRIANPAAGEASHPAPNPSPEPAAGLPGIDGYFGRSGVGAADLTAGGGAGLSPGGAAAGMPDGTGAAPGDGAEPAAGSERTAFIRLPLPGQFLKRGDLPASELKGERP